MFEAIFTKAERFHLVILGIQNACDYLKTSARGESEN
jgi:hypothetical protein